VVGVLKKNGKEIEIQILLYFSSLTKNFCSGKISEIKFSLDNVCFLFCFGKILIRVALIPLRDISISFGQHLILLLSSDFRDFLKQLPRNSVTNGMDVVIRIWVLKVLNFTGLVLVVTVENTH